MGHALVIQLARMGDIAQSLHLSRDLKRAGGDSVSMLVDGRLSGFLKNLAPWLDGVFTLDVEGYLRGFQDKASWVDIWERLAEEIEPVLEERFDRVLNLNFGRLAGSVASLVCRDRQVEGFSPAAEGSCGDDWMDFFARLLQTNRRWNRFHLVDVFRSLASRRFQPPGRSIVPAAVAGVPGVVAIQLGTRCAKRTWPPEAFVEVVRGLQDRQGVDILLLGDHNERWIARYVCERAGGSRVHDFVGKTSLSDLEEVLRGADVLVSGDTGTLHLASWLGVPSVGIFFGPAYAFETGPYGAGNTVIQVEGACSPCKETENCQDMMCRQTLTAEAVLCALRCEPLRLSPPLRAYRSGFVAGWLQFVPVEDRVASWEEILAYLYWGSVGEFVGVPPGSFPSMELSIRSLLAAYRVENLQEMPDEVWWDAHLPRGFSDGGQRRLRSILQDGWEQVREQIHGKPFEEPPLLEGESAGAGSLS